MTLFCHHAVKKYTFIRMERQEKIGILKKL